MKYLVIGHKFGDLGRGGFHVSKRFCDEHPDECEFLEDKKARDFEKLQSQYRRLIFRTQVPRCYNQPVNFVRLRKINHLIYLRAKYINPLYNNCTNGFYYYQAHKGFDNYIPMITDFPKQENKPKQECLGFYVRKWLTPDSFDCFMNLLDTLKVKTNVTIMGDPSPEIENHNNVLHYNHTYDNVQFFSEITHYIYPTSKHFVDPFPHSVLEAVQSDKQIVFPEIPRDFKDGIDDIKDCISWFRTYDSDFRLDNSKQPLTASNFKKFYQQVFENNWEFDFCRESCKTMSDFIQKFVL